ncbi:hypothetical protein AB0L64_11770 [Kribbella sp. NPDC051936]
MGGRSGRRRRAWRLLIGVALIWFAVLFRDRWGQLWTSWWYGSI